MANRRSLLTTLNEEEPNILFLNGTGGGEEYNGNLPIVVDNTNYTISFSESDCTGLNLLISSATSISSDLNNVNSNLTSFQADYNTFTSNLDNIYVLQTDYNTYTGEMYETISGINYNIDNLSDDLSNLSTLVDTKANQSDLNDLSLLVNTHTNEIEDLNTNLSSISDTVNDLQTSAIRLSANLDTTIETVNLLTSAVDDINVELTNKVDYTNLKYDSEEHPSSLTGISVEGTNYPIEIPGVTKNIYMHDYDNTLINLTALEGDDYSKIIPFASADNTDLGITGTPGVISPADKYKLDNIVMFNNNSDDMQLTYVGDNSGTSTFLGYSAGSLGFYDLNCPVESAMEDPSIMEDENNWSEHPFGISPDLYNMLRTLSAILSESGQHPYGMIGMTESGTLGWVDLE